jgi:hypothetical protein
MQHHCRLSATPLQINSGGLHKKSPAGNLAGGALWSLIEKDYRPVTLVAWGPLGPSVTSKFTFWPSFRVLNPSP